MKRRSLVALLLTLTCLFASTVPLFASNSNPLPIEQREEVVSPMSLTGQIGPSPGYKATKTINRSSKQNFATKTLVIAGLANIMGLNVADVEKSFMYLVSIMTAVGLSGDDLYYARTKYESPDGMSYYYKYDYFLDQAHNDSAGTGYSYVYGLWA